MLKRNASSNFFFTLHLFLLKCLQPRCLWIFVCGMCVPWCGYVSAASLSTIYFNFSLAVHDMQPYWFWTSRLLLKWHTLFLQMLRTLYVHDWFLDFVTVLVCGCRRWKISALADIHCSWPEISVASLHSVRLQIFKCHYTSGAVSYLGHKGADVLLSNWPFHSWNDIDNLLLPVIA